jgi:hypothetical protein
MPSINQLVRQGRRDVEGKEKAPALRGNQQKRSACTRLHHDAQQGEFGVADRRPCKADEWFRGDGLHLRRRV